MSERIEYPKLLRAATIGIVRRLLLDAAASGLPGEHHFYLTFDTRTPGVELAPALAAAHTRFGGEVRFLVIAVAVNQSQRSVQRHLEGHPMPYSVLWDARGRATRAFKAPTTSYVVVLDAEGTVAYTGVGAEQDLTGALDRILGRVPS